MNLILLLNKRKLSQHVKLTYSIWGLLAKPLCVNRDFLQVRKTISKLCICIVLFACGFANSVANEQLLIQDKIIPIGSDYQNSIKILDNRFRIDSDVKEVTIVFFRSFGSPPIVLVRPDGSKLVLERDLEDDSFNWYETDTYDMISLTNPMPGPWQAVGDILPESRIMVIAGITLHAEAIPKTIFSGETIKQTAYLENAGSRVDMSKFRDIVTLTIEFVSTNNPNFPNFGLGSRPVARFEDNGLGFDEYEADGTFTGQFDLNINEGEWRPVYTVRTPLFSREQVNENIVLHPSPINLSHKIEAGEQGEHILEIAVDQLFIADTGFVVDGTVKHPNGDIDKFSLTEPATTKRRLNIHNSDFGTYKVNMTVYASAIDGRELVLSIPEYAFGTTAPEVIIEPSLEIDTQLNDSTTQLVIQPAQEEPESFLILAIVINVVLLFIGSLIITLIVNKRNHPNDHFFLRLKNQIGRLKNKQSKPDSLEAKV